MAVPIPDADALRAIRAWVRLERGFDTYNQALRRRHRVTGAQLAMLRIVAEQEPVTLARLRSQLAMHPATIGQLIDRIVRLGLLSRRRAGGDGRVRELTLTARGRRLLARTPLAGPVRLRAMPADRARLRRLAAAFHDAIQLFGLEEWVT
jgi:DNA-binding MarR family transcriptional regulator